jgi:arylsulfatase A-like enzyme
MPVARSAALAILSLIALACSRIPHTEPERPASSPPNLIWIVVDTLRPDFLSCYGGLAKTPNIDALATKGTLFSRAYSHVPATGPSHSSMFTGLLPQQHGVAVNTQMLPKPLITAAEILSARGFYTASVVSLGVLQRRFGFDQGFQRYDDRFPNQWFRTADDITSSALALVDDAPEGPLFLFVHYSDPHEPYCPPSRSYPSIAVDVNGVAIGEVEASGIGAKLSIDLKPGLNTITVSDRTESLSGQINFRQIWVREIEANIRLGTGWTEPAGSRPGSLNTARLPATLLVESRDQAAGSALFHLFAYEKLSYSEARDRYADEVEYVDREIGKLMNELENRGLLSNAVVIFTSDHGEGLGDHGEMGHINQLYDTMVRVPLIILANDGLSGHAEPGRLVSHIDLLPTIADLLKIDLAHELPGRSLIEEPEDQAETTDPPVLIRTFRPEAPFDLEGLIYGGFKYINNHQTGKKEMYALQSDPEESANLMAAEVKVDSKKISENLISKLEEMLTTLKSVDTSNAMHQELDPDEIEKLKALGYLQ